MTTQRPTQVSWLRSQWPGGGLLSTIAVVVFCMTGGIRAAEVDSSNTPSPNPISVLLEYQETENPIRNQSVPIETRTASFKKEPSALSAKSLRGLLKFTQNGSNSIPFIWDRDAGKLFLDLNRNEDLTDDPKGVFSMLWGRQSFYQSFTNVHLSLQTDQGTCPVLVNLEINQYGKRLACYLETRSFWRGKVNLNGRNWQMGIIPVEGRQSYLLLRPWETRERSFNAADDSTDAFSFSKNLFLDGRAYGMDCLKETQDGQNRFRLQLTEKTVPLGEIKVTGKYVQRLVLSSESYLVVQEEPAEIVRVPAGRYDQPKVVLAKGKTEARLKSSRLEGTPLVNVTTQATTVLEIGGPLTNTVVARRLGNDLRLDYSLVGAGGLAYQLPDQSQPPTYTIYKGERALTSGTFEFG